MPSPAPLWVAAPTRLDGPCASGEAFRAAVPARVAMSRCFHPNSQFNGSCERGRPRYEPVTNVGPWPPPWPNMTTWDAHFHFGLSSPCHSFTTRPLARPFLVYFTSTKQATTHLPASSSPEALSSLDPRSLCRGAVRPSPTRV